MGSKKFWVLIYMMFYASISSYIQGKNSYNPDSLDSFIHDYAFKKIVKPHTGKLYNVSLPSNFSGIDVSFVRLRTGSLWNRGVNYSFFHIPPRILPWPFAKRLDIIYQNLGNLSSLYYNVPNYTFVAPVIGFLVYDSNSSLAANGMVDISMMGTEPIQVQFPHIGLPDDRNVSMKCVRFGKNGVVEFSQVNKTNACIAQGDGHFSIVVPSQPSKKEGGRLWKWWVIGFGVGIVAVIMVIVLMIVVCKVVRVNRLGKMERESERSEALESVWIGRSRMPSASGIRTQPVLEDSYVP